MAVSVKNSHTDSDCGLLAFCFLIHCMCLLLDGFLLPYLPSVMYEMLVLVSSLNTQTIPNLRFLVECRYQPDSVMPVSYLVKTPSFGAGVQPKEMFGVQLRIAKGTV